MKYSGASITVALQRFRGSKPSHSCIISKYWGAGEAEGTKDVGEAETVGDIGESPSVEGSRRTTRATKPSTTLEDRPQGWIWKEILRKAHAINVYVSVY